MADAASLGLHWIYNQPAIRRIAPEAPEFLKPEFANYEEGPAFFAHGDKLAGDISLYGENILVMLRSLRDSAGRFDEWAFLARFRSHFGPGGSYVGYIDSPTRESLYNAESMGRSIRTSILEMDLELTDARKRQVANYVARYVLDGTMARVRELVLKPLTLAGVSKRELTEVDRVFQAVERLRRPTGADDVQLPALTWVVPLVACCADADELEATVERAVRVTNDNDLAVAYALGLARLLQRLVDPPEKLGEPGPDRPADRTALLELILESYRDLPADYLRDLERALSLLRQETESITRTYGPACDCAMGTPSSLHNVLRSTSFVDAVRTNIYSSGDSCGRATIVGSAFGALHGIGGKFGIRRDWIGRTRVSGEVGTILDLLL